MNLILLVKQFYDRGKSQVKAFKRTLTKDFDHSSDYFFGLDLLMALSGARLNSRNTTVRRWWTIYRWLIPLPMIVIFWNGYLHIKRQAKLDIVLSSVQAMVGFVVIISRVLLILWHYEPLMEVRRYVNRRKFVYYSTTLNLASGAIYLSQLKTLTLFSIHTLYYCLLIALECASLTRMVNLLTEANQSIGWELYNLEWPIKLECDEKFQREYRKGSGSC
ncbi:hypothetical protein pipiens_003635 [Culex pipiens pipiens]|uniref:Uncharacterized protein n=1 Tax=Culex pipiens pipiens TaxID=38569 RepID=A0ABD1CUK2_CULPP